MTAATMGNAPAFATRPVTFVASDDAEARAAVMTLAADLGFEPADAGPLRHARVLEPAAMLIADQAYARGRGVGVALALVERPV
jgi:predicted dinucleotide-binding enzyme